MRSYLMAFILLIPIFLYSGQTSISEIQFTNNSGTDGTYPSPYRNQIVNTSGIVTAINLRSGGFYISEPQGGPWSGIFINDRTREVRVGDLVEITGEVAEQFGFTMIRNVRRLRVVSSGNPLPPPTPVTTSELAVSEAYESVLVQISNATINGRSDRADVLLINDGSGICRLSDGLYSPGENLLSITTGTVYSRIIGVVDYRFGEFRINPRHSADLQQTTVGTGKPSWGRIKSLYR